jgi:ATP-dependent Lon protease
MAELDRKAASVFAGKVVRKDLVRKVKVRANVPVFVLEYLLGKYCATDDPVAIDAGLKVVNNTCPRTSSDPTRPIRRSRCSRTRGSTPSLTRCRYDTCPTRTSTGLN